MNQEKEERLKTIASRIRKNQDITKGMPTYANCTHDVDMLINLILGDSKDEAITN